MLPKLALFVLHPLDFFQEFHWRRVDAAGFATYLHAIVSTQGVRVLVRAPRADETNNCN